MKELENQKLYEVRARIVIYERHLVVAKTKEEARDIVRAGGSEPDRQGMGGRIPFMVSLIGEI